MNLSLKADVSKEHAMMLGCRDVPGAGLYLTFVCCLPPPSVRQSSKPGGAYIYIYIAPVLFFHCFLPCRQINFLQEKGCPQQVVVDDQGHSETFDRVAT